jgi:hypothetical protein
MPHCAGCGRLYTALDVRTVMSVSARRTDTSPVRSPRSTPCITCNAAIVFSLRETANSARVAPLRGAAGAIVCSPLPLYVVFGADVFRNASVGIMRRPACVMTAGSALVATCCTTVRRQAASAPRLHICPSLHRHPQRFAHACLPRVMVGWDTGTARLRTRVTPAGQR